MVFRTEKKKKLYCINVTINVTTLYICDVLSWYSCSVCVFLTPPVFVRLYGMRWHSSGVSPMAFAAPVTPPYPYSVQNLLIFNIISLGSFEKHRQMCSGASFCFSSLCFPLILFLSYSLSLFLTQRHTLSLSFPIMHNLFMHHNKCYKANYEILPAA